MPTQTEKNTSITVRNVNFEEVFDFFMDEEEKSAVGDANKEFNIYQGTPILLWGRTKFDHFTLNSSWIVRTYNGKLLAKACNLDAFCSARNFFSAQKGEDGLWTITAYRISPKEVCTHENPRWEEFQNFNWHP